jgi:xanthine dehydrogenase YagR molybdenum-binding subunit
MAEYKWPEAEKRSLIGKRISRIDGPHKVSGRAKYSYDVKRPGVLYARMLRSPHAHAKIVSIDISAAEKMPGVKAVRIVQKPGTEIKWAGDDIVGVAAIDESTAEDAVRAIKVQYEVLHLVIDAGRHRRAS